MLIGLGQIARLFRGRFTDRADGAFQWHRLRSQHLQGWYERWFGPAADQITVIHVTHHKAGSQWVNRILHQLAYDRLVVPIPIAKQFLEQPIQPGKVYPTVYVTREEFERVELPPHSRRFVVIRDLRDTLISAYFSIKHSHEMSAEEHLRMRARLQSSSFEDGLLYLLNSWYNDPTFAAPPAVQRSWLGGPDDVLKYEDLLEDDERIFEAVLLDHCRLPVSRERFREVIRANRFEARSGRKRGEENIASHERKGIAGDWRNYFTDKLARTFKDRYGELLIATGYEKDDRW
jgi:lipopolysaccharide transport system ATP-binding protein